MSAEAEILKLLRKEKRLRLAYDKRRLALAAEIGRARAKLKHCSHPLREPFEWEHDNGYGRQSMNDGERCLVCGKQNRWPGSGSWY